MILEYLFLVSGLCLALLIFEKVREMKTRREPFLLRLISRGDERLVDYSHRFAHVYADAKEEVRYFVEKQLPLYARRISNKTETLVAEKTELVKRHLRDSKYFKKNGDISDFFKSLAEGEHMDKESDGSSATEENPLE